MIATSGAGTATFPEHLSSPLVLVGFVLHNLQFCVQCFWIVVLFVFFLLAIAFCFDLRFRIIMVFSNFSCYVLLCDIFVLYT